VSLLEGDAVSSQLPRLGATHWTGSHRNSTRVSCLAAFTLILGGIKMKGLSPVQRGYYFES